MEELLAAEVERDLARLRRGAVDIISEAELRLALRESKVTGRPLKVKYGADPSAPDLHVGHMVVINKLREFQELGHTVQFVIGDFTGRIGDPSGRQETRRQLSAAEVAANARTYQDQIFRVLDAARTVVLFNNDWLGQLDFAAVVELTAKVTLARVLERDDFARRLAAGLPISLHELLYCLAQAYDSVHLRSDVELGGTDQTFNFVLARDIQRAMGQRPQVVMTMPLLEGTDGVLKMSKSLGNYIGITEPPGEMVGKAMSLPDHLIGRYLLLATDVPEERIREITDAVAAGTLNPRDAKLEMATALAARYHGAAAARAAAAEFVRVFSQGELPADIPTAELSADQWAQGHVGLAHLLVWVGLAPSASEARRLVNQGGVRVDGRRVDDSEAEVELRPGLLLQVGHRRFRRLAGPVAG